MRVIMAQFKIKDEALKEFAAARDRILTALSDAQPKGVGYTWCAMPDGRSFIGWLELDEGIENPLPGLDAGKVFVSRIQNLIAAPPVREELQVVGSWRSAT